MVVLQEEADRIVLFGTGHRDVLGRESLTHDALESL